MLWVGRQGCEQGIVRIGQTCLLVLLRRGELTLLIDGTLAAGRLEQNPAIPAAAKDAACAAVERACPPAA